MKRFFITCCVMTLFLFVKCKAACVTSLYEVQQSLFTYIYLIRQDPVHFDSYIKNVHNELKIFHDIDKAMNIASDMVKIIDIKTCLSFNNDLYILQGERQYAIVKSEGESSQLKSSAFIISNYPPFKNKVLLILSATSPVQLVILSFDQCLNVEVLFDSMSPVFVKYREDISATLPLWKVILTKNDIELYEYHRTNPYSLNKLLSMSK